MNKIQQSRRGMKRLEKWKKKIVIELEGGWGYFIGPRAWCRDLRWLDQAPPSHNGTRIIRGGGNPDPVGNLQKYQHPVFLSSKRVQRIDTVQPCFSKSWQNMAVGPFLTRNGQAMGHAWAPPTLTLGMYRAQLHKVRIKYWLYISLISNSLMVSM